MDKYYETDGVYLIREMLMSNECPWGIG